MVDSFPVIDVAEDAPEVTEMMGTKYKFWFQHPTLGRCLYKQPRRNSGEDWTEKIAAELAKLLGLPHAQYELASFQGHFGTISLSFLPENSSFSFIPGNQILPPTVPHKLDLVLKLIADNKVHLPINWTPPN